MNLKPISRNELQLVDESSGWVPGAFVAGLNPNSIDGENNAWNPGHGIIISVIDDEGVSVLWTHKPGWNPGFDWLDTGYVFAPYIPLQVTPTIFPGDLKAPKPGNSVRYSAKKIITKFWDTVKVRDLK